MELNADFLILVKYALKNIHVLGNISFLPSIYFARFISVYLVSYTGLENCCD